MRYIVREIRHFMKQSSFWLSVGIVLFCFFFEHRDYFSFYAAGELLYALDVFYLFVTPFEYGLFFYLVPLAAIPPAALSVIDELKSGHARLKLYRSSQKAYIAKRLVSISIGSMLPMLIGCLLFFAFSMLLSFPYQRAVCPPLVKRLTRLCAFYKPYTAYNGKKIVDFNKKM